VIDTPSKINRENSLLSQNNCPEFDDALIHDNHASHIPAIEHHFETTLQPKLKIGQPDDPYEREADRMADFVVRQISSGPSSALQKKEKPVLQLKETDASYPVTAPDNVAQKLSQKKGKGNSLPFPLQAQMEQSFGTDFSQVRVHTDSDAIQLNQQLGARAFTHGSDVYFNRGEFQPSSTEGQRLLAHELTHVVQQTGTLNQGERLQRQAGAGTLGKLAIRKALGWLSKRGANISRHVARHTRVIANRAVHTVFRSPNQVKKLAERTLKSADNVVVQAGRHKTRYIVEKQFNRVIGKNGETILKLVIEGSGKIITAYPVSQFTRAGVIAGIMYLSIDEASAQAREKLDIIEANAQRMIEAETPSFWEEVFNDIITFGLYGGRLNAGEDAALYTERESRKVMEEAALYAISEIEREEQRSIGSAEREEIRNLVLSGLQTGIEM
jgi:hypothetical protein